MPPSFGPVSSRCSDHNADALAHALRYDGKRRVHHADGAMARITAEHLIRHLAQAGFVLMRQEPGAAPTTAGMLSSLAAGAFDCVDAAVILQNHDPAAVRRVPRFCNGLFISLAPNLGRGSNFVFVAEKNEAVKRHSVLPTFLAARGRIRAKV